MGADTESGCLPGSGVPAEDRRSRSHRSIGRQSVRPAAVQLGPIWFPPSEPHIDSVGIYFTPAMRHFDRGWRETAGDRFGEMEYVFGASGAAALYRRAMIDDISAGGNFFDPDFFSYREDADVAWRAQLLGWGCLYTPEAVGYHVRRVVSGNRRARTAVHQHALREEPVPVAHQERDAGHLSAVLAAGHASRSGGRGRLLLMGAEVASGVLAFGELPSSGTAQPAGHHGPPACGR